MKVPLESIQNLINESRNIPENLSENISNDMPKDIPVESIASSAPVMKDLFDDVHFIYSICMDKQGKLDFYCDCPIQNKTAGRLIAHFIYALTRGGMTQQMLTCLYDNPEFSESFVEFVIKNVSTMMDLEDKPVILPSEFMRKNAEGDN